VDGIELIGDVIADRFGVSLLSGLGEDDIWSSS